MFHFLKDKQGIGQHGELLAEPGGVWERLIHSVRRALLALSNEREMNEDQLRTFLNEAESIVNSRPLTPVTLEVDSDLPLTPKHFLKMSASSGLHPVAVGNGDCQPRRGWWFVQHVSDQFWRRFSKEYLRTILQRQKWHRLQRTFATDYIVLVVDNSSPRSQWPLGRVLEAYPDEHGVVRSVLVRLKGREIKRPIHKLCLIQPSDENESANGGRWTRDLERGLRLPRSLDVRVTTECTIHDFYNCLTYE